MSTIKFVNLGLKPNEDVKTIQITLDGIEQEIEVKQYVPIDKKYDIMVNVFNKSKEGGTHNDLLLTCHTELEIFYAYTNIEFTEDEKDDEFFIYDKLQSNGIIDAVIKAIPIAELQLIYDSIESFRKNYMDYTLSLAGILARFMSDLPAEMEAVQNMVGSFDKEKYQEVVNFAKAANGGREIPKE